MSKTNASKVAGELGLALQQVEATSALLDEGATVPFIAVTARNAPARWTKNRSAPCGTGCPSLRSWTPAGRR